MSLRAGARLGPYEVQSLLGAGGMGEVWRAHDARLGRAVALKVLRPELAADPKRIKRFEQEARAAARAAHPGIVTVLDFGSHEGAPYVVTELLEGETLRQLLGRGPVEPAEVLRIGIAIGDALGSAHERGIVHRDLKPENIMRLEDGRLKVLDFGIAKLREAPPRTGEAQSTHTMTTQGGARIGTVGYMSPEQVRGEPVDARSDLFSLGAILHELLAGKPAFTGAHDVERMMAIVEAPAAALPPASEDEPPSLRPAIARCLAKDPADRFATARDLHDALLRPEAPSIHRPGAARSAPRGLALLAMAFFGLVLGAGGYSLGRRGVAEPEGQAPPPTPAGRAASAATEAGRGAAEPTFQQLTFRPGTLLSARFLPGGQNAIYGARWGGSDLALYSGSLGSSFAQALVPGSADVLAVSTTGELALSLGRRMLWWPAEGTLARGSLDGSSPREVVAGVVSADFGPDGENLVVARRVAGRGRLEYPLDTVLFETTGWIGDVRVAPSGRQIAFVHHPRWMDDQGGIMTVDFEGRARTLVEGLVSVQGLAWGPTGEEVWFSGVKAGAGNDYSVFAVSAEGRLRRVLGSPARLRLHDVAPDGAVLLSREEVRAVTLAKRRGEPGDTDLSWLDLTVVTSLSGDGQSALLSEQSAGDQPSFDVQWRRTDGSPPKRLGEGQSGDLSPDGHWALTVSFETTPRLVLLPTGVGERRVLGRPDVAYRMGRWFPDGRILALGAEPGKGERFWQESTDGAPSLPLSEEGDWANGMITQDGKSLLLLDSAGLLRARPLDGAGKEVQIRLQEGEEIGGVSDRGEVYVYRRGMRPALVELLDPRTERRRPFASLSPADPTGFVEVSRCLVTPDGAAYAYTWYRQLSVLYLASGLH